MAVYTNDLRLKEIATGDEAGTWGNSTNTNLQLIADAFGFGTEAITTNADTHTTTIADGSADAGRAIFLKYTGTLDSACTITIGPNTVSKMWFIENATSGSQNIIIKQGSGATVTIPAGDTKAIYSDGAGSGGAMVDAFASLNVVDLKVEDDLTVTDDLIVNGDIDLEGSIDVNGTANLDVVDIDGAVDMASTLQVDGAITSSAGATITVTDNSDVLTLVSTDGDNDTGPVFVLKRNSASPADNDFLGRQQFVGKNDAGEEFVGTDILVRIIDASDGTEDARLDINTMVAGVSRNRITVTESEAIMNEGSIDVDFRVESDGNANMLFVDGGNDRVSIKTGSAINSATLSVAGSIAFDGQSVGTYNDASGWIDFTSTSDTNLMRIHSGGDTGESSQIEISTVVSGSQSDAISVESGGTTVINQDSVDIRDFRVESDSNTHMLFVDAGNDAVGIGTSSPVSNSGYGNLTLNGTSGSIFSLMHNGTEKGRIVGGSSSLSIQYPSDGVLTFFDGVSGGTERIRITSSGALQLTGDSGAGETNLEFTANSNTTKAKIMGAKAGSNGGTLRFHTTDSSGTLTERVRVDDSGSLGIGTTSPESGLHVVKSASASRGATITLDNTAGSDVGNEVQIAFLTDSGASVAGTANARIKGVNVDAGNGAADIRFHTWNGSAEGERVRIRSAGGITFNGDSAAANALDDYEEGTWTGSATAGSATSISVADEKYTKIGNQVTVQCTINFSGASGSLNISGLPFATSPAAVGIGREDATSGYAVYGRATSGGTTFSIFWAGGVTNATPFQTASGNMRYSMTYLT